MTPQKGEITILLERMNQGDKTAEDALVEYIYVELHRLAVARLRGERANHSLQPTALVHEVYIRLCRAEQIEWRGRTHFFCVAARLMRRILTDHARHRNALKENSGAPMIPLRDDIAISGEQYVEALEIDDLLVRLAEFRPRAAKVVEMRFFAGLGEREIAEALGVHVRTIRRDWEFAQAWLHSEIKPD